MAGRKQKDPEALVGHRDVKPREVVTYDPNEHVEPPRPPDQMSWSAAAMKRWDALWNTPQASSWNWESSYALVVQYVSDFDDWLSFRRSARRKPMVKGSMGQDVVNPLRGEMARLEGEMRRIEEALYLSPRAMLGASIEWRASQRNDDDDGERDVEEAERAARAEAALPEGWHVVAGEGEVFDEDEHTMREDVIDAEATEIE